MAKKEHISETPATQFLRKHKAGFSEHPYPYEEHGGTSVSARELGVPEHSIQVSLRAMDTQGLAVLRDLLHSSRVSMGSDVFNESLAGFCPCHKFPNWAHSRLGGDARS